MSTVMQTYTKIINSLDELSGIIKEHKENGDVVVHCHGVFDVVHVGHIKYLQEAKSFGDILVVTVTPDKYVNKGPNRPVFTEQLRLEVLAALEYVDYVALNCWATATETIKLLKPNIYIKGPDYKDLSKDRTKGIFAEKDAIESVGGELQFTSGAVFSSSSIINNNVQFSPFSAELKSYLERFSDKYTFGDVMEYLDKMTNLKVLVIGESIIDDYHYCSTLGKAGKEPILAVNYVRQERFVGGALAVANHLAQLSNNVTLVSFLGKNREHEDFIIANLNPKINAQLLSLADGPTIVKRRFLEIYPLQKLFEVYEMGNDEGCDEDSNKLCQQLNDLLEDYDVVVVADYGHGMMSSKAINLLCNKASFLSVNTQVNAGNQGFNTISKYPKADFISISGKELLLDARTKKSSFEELVQKLSKALGTKEVVITKGRDGILCYSSKEGFCSIPSWNTSFVDRVGAGDAVLSITSLLAKLGAPLDILGLVSNAVGYQMVGVAGNKKSINVSNLLRMIEYALK